MTQTKIYDIAIIGAGPGGYVAAIRASQLGAKVILIEEKQLGGVCLNKGCIPSKSLLLASDKLAEFKKSEKLGISFENLNYDYSKIFERKNLIIEKIRKNISMLLNSNEITVIEGKAKVLTQNFLSVNDETIEFENLIIATGSRPSSVPGLVIDNNFIVSSDDMLEMENLPETVLIVGSGPIGVEWARILSNLNKKVYLVEVAPKLTPFFDEDLSKIVERLFKKQRLEFYTNTVIEKIENKTVTLSNGKSFSVDKILVAAGRLPNVENIGLESVGVTLNGKFIKIDENFKTEVSNIYAIGDVTGKQMLAHTASAQAEQVVENILLQKSCEIDYLKIPSVIYGKPEIASVGYKEQDLKDLNIDYKSSLVPLSVTGKAIVDDEIDGFVKLLSSGDKLLGAHIIANEASAMIVQCAIAMQVENGVELVKNTVFPHPTISEAVHEGFLNLDGEAIHMLRVKK